MALFGRFIIIPRYFDNGYHKWDGFRCPKCGRVNDPDETSNPDVLFHCPGCGFESNEPAFDPEEE